MSVSIDRRSRLQASYIRKEVCRRDRRPLWDDAHFSLSFCYIGISVFPLGFGGRVPSHVELGNQGLPIYHLIHALIASFVRRGGYLLSVPIVALPCSETVIDALIVHRLIVGLR